MEIQLLVVVVLLCISSCSGYLRCRVTCSNVRTLTAFRSTTKSAPTLFMSSGNPLSIDKEPRGPSRITQIRQTVQRRCSSISKALLQRVLFVRAIFASFLGFQSKPTNNGTTSSGSPWVKRRRNNSDGFLSIFVTQLRSMFSTPIGVLRFALSVMFLTIIQVSRAKSRVKVVELSYATFLKMLSETPELISKLTISSGAFHFQVQGGKAFARAASLSEPLLSRLLASKVDFSVAAPPTNRWSMVFSGLYLVFLFTMARRMLQGPQDEGAGKARDALDLQRFSGLSFDDIAGQENAKQEVRELCEMLRDPARFQAAGARLPSGVLLVGPPGSGKTLLARVTAAEANVPFFACSASDFVEVFVGRGPARVRKLFQRAAQNAPSIVFIDELDSIGRSRRLNSLNSEQENTLNQLLTSMDGLDTSQNGVIVLAATNRLELLDSALLRAGRFDRIIQCPLPDLQGRRDILEVHTQKLQLCNSSAGAQLGSGEVVDLDRIARLTNGLSGADLATVCNEASIRAARRRSVVVTQSDFESGLRSFLSVRLGASGGLGAVAEGLGINRWLGKLLQTEEGTMGGKGKQSSNSRNEEEKKKSKGGGEEVAL